MAKRITGLILAMLVTFQMIVSAEGVMVETLEMGGGEKLTNDFGSDLSAPFSFNKPGDGSWLYSGGHMYAKVNKGQLEILTRRIDTTVTQPLGMRADISNTENPDGYMQDKVEVEFDLMDYLLGNGDTAGVINSDYTAEFDIWGRTKWGNNVPLIGILNNELRIYDGSLTNYTSTVIDNVQGYYAAMPTNKFGVCYDLSESKISVFMDDEPVAERTIENTVIKENGLKEIVIGALIHKSEKGKEDTFEQLGIGENGCAYIALVDNLSIGYTKEFLEKELKVEDVVYRADSTDNTLSDGKIDTFTEEIDVLFSDGVDYRTLKDIEFKNSAGGENLIGKIVYGTKENTCTIYLKKDVLELSTDYILTIPKTVTSKAGVSLKSAYEQGVTTNEGALSLREIAFLKDNAAIESVASKDKLTPYVKIVNTIGAEQTFYVSYGIYSDESMIGFGFKAVEVTEDKKLVEATLDEFEVPEEENLSVRLFVWNDFNKMKSKIKSITISEN